MKTKWKVGDACVVSDADDTCVYRIQKISKDNTVAVLEYKTLRGYVSGGWLYFSVLQKPTKKQLANWEAETLANSNKITNKERQAAFKQRMRTDGFVLTAIWVHADDLERVKKYIARLRDKRMP